MAVGAQQSQVRGAVVPPVPVDVIDFQSHRSAEPLRSGAAPGASLGYADLDKGPSEVLRRCPAFTAVFDQYGIRRLGGGRARFPRPCPWPRKCEVVSCSSAIHRCSMRRWPPFCGRPRRRSTSANEIDPVTAVRRSSDVGRAPMYRTRSCRTPLLTKPGRDRGFCPGRDKCPLWSGSWGRGDAGSRPGCSASCRRRGRPRAVAVLPATPPRARTSCIARRRPVPAGLA